MRVALLSIGVALAACKGHSNDGRSCAQVGARFHDIAQAQLAATTDLPADQRAGVAGLLAPMRDSLVLACRVDKWTAPARNCFADATTQSSFYGCDVHLTVDQRANLSQAAH